MCDTLIERETQQVILSFSDFGQSYSGLSGKTIRIESLIQKMSVLSKSIKQSNSLLSVMEIFFLRYLLKRRRKLEWVLYI